MTTITMLLFVAGFVLLIWGADMLVRGAAHLAAAAGVSALVIGLTVVAIGTSAPELAVSVQAALAGQPDLTLGNVLGSNIANVLLILGLAAVVAPLLVAPQLLRREVPAMIAVSGLVWLLATDGALGRLDGALLVSLLGAFLITSAWLARRASTPLADPEPSGSLTRGSPLRNIALVIGGLILLIVGAQWLVDGAVAIARILGVSELVIGLTVIAVGTSLPEIATSVLAGIRGERDIAVGNVVGSNIINLLGVLGATALLAPQAIVVPPAALSFDLPVMFATAVACLPIFFNGQMIARWEGMLFLGYYLAYTTFLVLAAVGSRQIETFTDAMLFFVLPLTALTVAVATYRSLRAAPRPD
ncbi:MAG: calcium/sodium antiporter [Chloroflexi bacterium OHK40]